ncbi:hypothetical protein [Arthrobacter pascens]|uniref:hypothetical protein n=1 Tax=Arthrobacter pascens TaxID=1677 RepID=UPI0027D929E3|nr:hypothetical protein [Arthrobacter pascens]
MGNGEEYGPLYWVSVKSAPVQARFFQDVLTKGSGLLIPQKLGVPDAAKPGTNEWNNQT